MLLEAFSKLVFVDRDLHWISCASSIKEYAKRQYERTYIAIGGRIDTRSSRFNHFVLLLSFGRAGIVRRGVPWLVSREKDVCRGKERERIENKTRRDRRRIHSRGPRIIVLY